MVDKNKLLKKANNKSNYEQIILIQKFQHLEKLQNMIRKTR
jgi:hypothetical protein